MARFAILSVTDKTGIVELAKSLIERLGYSIIASGGTAQLLLENNIPVTKVTDFTGTQEILNGRVKTLHPKIYAGLLALDSTEHQKELDDLNYPRIDLVVCNLYNFKDAVDTLARRDEIINYIDIGGPTLIRAAAKNYSKVSVLTDPSDYSSFIENSEDMGEGFRLELASKAFRLVAYYDVEISKYFGKAMKLSNEFLTGTNFDLTYYLAGDKLADLRYGENAHQKASIYSDEGESFYNHLNGKKVSYNNILDLTAAMELVYEFNKPACSIIKHRTPCGVAENDNQVTAFKEALASDPVSAFGGVFCFNTEITDETATELNSMFVDVVLAPGFTASALAILKQKEKLTILERTDLPIQNHDLSLIPGGFVVQNHDIRVLQTSDCEIMTDDISSEIIDDAIFAFKVVKHAKSNAVVICSPSASYGVASGEPNRVDAVKHAIERAGDKTKGAILASDAFFPFPDSIVMAAEAGIKTVIVPKGSIRDNLVVEEAKKNGINLIFTKIRAFKH